MSNRRGVSCWFVLSFLGVVLMDRGGLADLRPLHKEIIRVDKLKASPGNRTKAMKLDAKLNRRISELSPQKFEKVVQKYTEATLKSGKTKIDVQKKELELRIVHFDSNAKKGLTPARKLEGARLQEEYEKRIENAKKNRKRPNEPTDEEKILGKRFQDLKGSESKILQTRQMSNSEAIIHKKDVSGHDIHPNGVKLLPLDQAQQKFQAQQKLEAQQKLNTRPVISSPILNYMTNKQPLTPLPLGRSGH